MSLYNIGVDDAEIEQESTLENNRIVIPVAIRPSLHSDLSYSDLLAEWEPNNKRRKTIGSGSSSSFETFIRHPKPDEPNTKQKIARNGQQIWKDIYKEMLRDFNEAVSNIETTSKQQLIRDNVKSIFHKGMKNKNRCIYMYLEMCEINGLIDVVRDDHKPEFICPKATMKGFVGITRIQIKNPEIYGWEFFNRLVLMKRGIWKSFHNHNNNSSHDDKQQILITRGELNTIHNIFRNIGFSPTLIGEWQAAFQGKDYLIYNETNKNE